MTAAEDPDAVRTTLEVEADNCDCRLILRDHQHLVTRTRSRNLGAGALGNRQAGIRPVQHHVLGGVAVDPDAIAVVGGIDRFLDRFVDHACAEARIQGGIIATRIHHAVHGLAQVLRTDRAARHEHRLGRGDADLPGLGPLEGLGTELVVQQTLCRLVLGTTPEPRPVAEQVVCEVRRRRRRERSRLALEWTGLVHGRVARLFELGGGCTELVRSLEFVGHV